MMTRQEARARVLYADGQVRIFNKPPGLAVHYGIKSDDHLERYLPLIVDAGVAPLLAHRLDKDTAGCLILANDAMVAARLGRLFAKRMIEKTYWAVVLGGPTASDGVIDLPLLKTKIPGQSKVTVDPAGKPALTAWRRLDGCDGLAWLEMRPLTGRMHQIRAHCAYMGWPILGDPRYGAEMPAPCHLHLLARAVRMPALDETGQATGAAIEVQAPPPDHMHQTLSRMSSYSS
jgi:tRNA pseudouridine32 synthase / 23S rRNA pseudouridine746 synthase